LGLDAAADTPITTRHRCAAATLRVDCVTVAGFRPGIRLAHVGVAEHAASDRLLTRRVDCIAVAGFKPGIGVVVGVAGVPGVGLGGDRIDRRRELEREAGE